MQIETVTYPEHHAAWLEVMGVNRWQHREPIEVAHIETGVEINEETQHNVLTALPERIQSARYWILGNAALTAEETFLLAGMMAAIKAQGDEVVYSHLADQLDFLQLDTGLATFPRLSVQTLPDLNVALPEGLKVLQLGDAILSSTHASMWRIPSLSGMLSTPLLKREAWQVLKTMWASEV